MQPETVRAVTRGEAKGGIEEDSETKGGRQIETRRPPVHESESAVTLGCLARPTTAPPHLRAIAMHVLATHAGEAIHKLGVQPL